MPKVREYLQYLNKEEYDGLFRQECQIGFQNISRQFGELETEETIQEVHLGKEDRECDYSIRVDLKDSVYIREYWLELDDAACRQMPISPCWFIDASAVKPGEKSEWLYEEVLPQLLSAEEAENIAPMIRQCVEFLKGKAEGLFQIGLMAGRNQRSLRLFTDDMDRTALLSYLSELHWKGDLDKLDEWLKKLEPFSQRRKFILDFDVLSTGISRKVGINFGSRDKRNKTIEELLNFFESCGLCIPSKGKDVERWIKRRPSHTPFIQNDISHFKMPFDGEKMLEAKAYLRQGSRAYVPYQVFETPYLMNLELTTRCPLHCPQCYCELENGKNLSLEQAEYWIEEAAKNGVQTVNLSGGETMCYPYIYDLVQKTADNGMEANIAVSGYHFGREEIRKFVRAGIGDICVSLNAPVKEINDLTRDGFELAVKALEVLREERFPRICINWVMHNNNADTLEAMVKLAERYQAATLAVMVFKPDAAHQRKSLPSLEQIKRAADFIKRYKGPVTIEVESCFSQLRALTGENFFINKNVGISRGCGAGRDAVSVNVDGNLTPCRHIELPEDEKNLKCYWDDSEVLKKLRNVEKEIRVPCKECAYSRNCLPCMAVNLKMNGKIYMGEEGCAVWRKM